jgi:hypothetical protein
MMDESLFLEDFTKEFFSFVPFTSMGSRAFSSSGASKVLSLLNKMKYHTAVTVPVSYQL